MIHRQDRCRIETQMFKFIICYFLVLFSDMKAEQSEFKLDGRAGLKRGVYFQEKKVSYGNFAADKFHRLQVSVGLSIVVSNYRECAISCVENPTCSSLNVASSPNSEGNLRCELLNEDKYSASPGKLVSSQEYHHYSIKVFIEWPNNFNTLSIWQKRVQKIVVQDNSLCHPTVIRMIKKN